MPPVLSVITPVYRGAAFLARCIGNVRAQGLGGRVEHVVMDGGSQDGSVDILRRCAGRDTRLVWRSERDAGQSDAMNKGTAIARGAIIGALNVDDEYLPGALAAALDAFEGLDEPSLVIGDCEVVDENGALLFVNRPRARSLFGLAIGLSHPINPAAYFYHRSLHALAGGYDPSDHYSLDLDFLYRAMQRANVVYLPRTLGRFRVAPGTKTYADQAHASARLRRLQHVYSRALPLGQRLAQPWCRAGLMFYRRLRDGIAR